MDKPVDIIVPYVNCWDPIWLKEATKYLNTIIYNRFRDLGTIRYFFRGVEFNMPWINKVYFVVQSQSQIPKWLNINHPKLKIIYHEDFIPKKYLPTFNSYEIELFYHKIEGLSKQFIVANDDMAAIQPLEKENFFKNGKIVYTTKKHENFNLNECNSSFSITLYNAVKATGKITGKNNYTLYQHHHLFTPHLKSLYKFGWKKYKHGLLESFKHSKTRSNKNIIHYLFLYLAEELKLVENDNDYKEGYLDIFDNTKPEEIIKILNDNQAKMCCLNDKFIRTNDNEGQKIISSILENYLPNKSTFEL